MHNTTHHYDVVIVGAGIAGLVAARQLRQHNLSVCIVEANDRIGGRIWDITSKHGHILPLGATWIGPDEEKVPALMAELGLKTMPQYETGQLVFRLCGQQKTVMAEENARVGAFPLPGDNNMPADFLTAIKTLDTLCQEVSLTTPYSHPRAAEWDALTVEEWLTANTTTNEGETLLRLVIGDELFVALDDFSFLCLLFLWRSILSLLVDDRRIKGGPQQIVQALAADMANSIHLQTTAKSIHQDSNQVTIHTDKQIFTGQYAIVTTPPNLHSKIDFQPPMPMSRQQITSRAHMGKTIKVFVVYKTPFWRDNGLSGISLADDSILGSTFDVSPDNHPHGILVGFISGNAGTQWRTCTAAEREAAVVKQLTTLFGPPAAQPIDYVEKDWIAEPWTGGCYCAILPTNVLAAHGPAIREPVGRIHWAGTETAALWYGSMEGAILSSERVVEEILASVRGEG